MALTRFYWLIEGALAGCSRPGRVQAAHSAFAARERTPEPAGELDADLAQLREEGIGALLSLTETPLPAEALARYGLASAHLPIPDMSAPTPEEFERALRFIDYQRGLGRAVAVHCLMGQGRTGSVLAAYLIRGGATPDAALATVRAVCPGAVCTAEQEQALRAFARRRDWIL